MVTPPVQPKPRKRDRLDPRKVRIGGKLFWQVDLGSELHGGRRHRLRRTFALREEAETFSRLKKIERTNRGTAGISLPEHLRGEAIEADRLLEPYNVSILEVVRQYVQRREQNAKSETVGNAVKAFLASRAGDNLRQRYLTDLRIRLNKFSKAFGEQKVAAIEPAEIDHWLREMCVAPWTRNTFHQRLSVFFEFARQRGWAGTNPMANVPKAKVISSPPGILSPEQVARLFESASGDTLPYWVLGAFAGLRSAEIERLQWRHIKWDERLIEVPALSSKTASRRLVTMQPNLLAWLEPYRSHQGPICLPNHYQHMIEDRRNAGITDWPSNALRHSYASYHLAAFKDAPALSLELGHVRPQTVFAHYREVVRPAEAERFWKIAPTVSEASIVAVA
jgi:integrase